MVRMDGKFPSKTRPTFCRTLNTRQTWVGITVAPARLCTASVTTRPSSRLPGWFARTARSYNPSVCGETVYQYWWGYRYYYGEWECEYEVTENEKTGYYFYASSKSNKYYDPDRDAYFASRDAAFPYLVKDENGQEIDVQLDWEEAWGLVTPWRYAQITGDWQPYDQYNPNSNSTLTGDDKDSRMTDICGKAKEKGVIIYTIAFEMGEADGSNASALSSCASSSENSFAASLDGSVSGIDGTARTIEEVFEVIAASVKKLSLRQ